MRSVPCVVSCLMACWPQLENTMEFRTDLQECPSKNVLRKGPRRSTNILRVIDARILVRITIRILVGEKVERIP